MITIQDIADTISIIAILLEVVCKIAQRWDYITSFSSDSYEDEDYYDCYHKKKKKKKHKKKSKKKYHHVFRDFDDGPQYTSAEEFYKYCGE